METWQLNTFSVVAKNLHFTKAAEELKLTQSAVSHQIKSLEEELGVKLFLRKNKQNFLTPQGKKVLNYAERILLQIELMRKEIKENKDSLQGKIKIVAVPRSLNVPFHEIKREFQMMYPDIELFFESAINSDTVFENVRKGISDIGFTTQNQDFQDLLMIPFGKFEMLFVVGKNHPLNKKKKAILSDLENEEWALFEEGSWLRKQTDNIFLQQNFVPKIVSESNDGAVIRSLIKENSCVGFLPNWGIIDALEEKKLISVTIKDVKNSVPLNIAISAGNSSKLTGLFINFLLEKKLKGIETYKNSKVEI
jgi:DNA-binding transcriptional LysR family regulator